MTSWKPRFLTFRLLSFFVVLYSKTKAKSPKAKKAIAGEASLDRVYDLAIIGGGVNGCGIARDAAAVNAAPNDGEVVHPIQRRFPGNRLLRFWRFGFRFGVEHNEKRKQAKG